MQKCYFSKAECDEFFTRTGMMYTLQEIDVLSVYVTVPTQRCVDYRNPLHLWL